MAGVENGQYRFGSFELDAPRRRLTLDGETMSVNPKAFDLLLELIRHRGSVVSKDELLSAVWPDQIVEENNVSVHVSALRKLLSADSDGKQLIATIPGRGYSFVAPVECIDDDLVIEQRTVERIVIEHDGGETAPNGRQLLPGGKPNRKLLITAVAVLVLAASVTGVWWWKAQSVRPDSRIESIAVLPLSYQGSRQDSDYFSDGFTESLINNLSQIPNLSVKARSSVFPYKGRDLPPQKIADELRVQAVMTGNIVETDDGMTVSLELVNSSTGDQIWGERFVRKRSEIATLSNDIARDVVGKLRLKLAGEPVALGQTRDAEAYEAYLKGRYFWNKRTKEDHVRALALFRRAIERDPNYALAYAAISDVYAVDTAPVPREQAVPLARSAAMTALSIEPNLGEAYSTLAALDWDAYDWEKAEANFRRSIELNPNYSTAHHWLAEMLCRLGRHDEAIAEINIARRLEPVSLSINNDNTYILAMARRFDDALEQAKRTSEIDAAFGADWLSYTYEYLERYDEALDAMLDHPDGGNADPAKMSRFNKEIELIRERYHREGPRGYWSAWLDWETDKFRNGDLNYTLGMAVCNVKLGDNQKALDYLESAVSRRSPGSDMLLVDPHYDEIRSEPRFIALLQKLKLQK